MGSFGAAVAMLWTLAVPAAAQNQNAMSNADVQRLETAIADASRELAGVGSRDLSSQLEGMLEEAREDAIYLKVKMRKGESVPRSEYFDLRDRIDDIRARSKGTAAPPRATTPGSTPAPGAGGNTGNTGRATSSRGDLPVGTELDVRLGSSLNSGTAQVEQRFEATTVVDITEGDRILVPAGSVLRGVVSSVQKAGRLERRGSMTLTFDQITVRGKDRPVRATVTQALESSGVRGEAGKIGTGAGVGAVIGGILGGVKGAIAGILIGGGGTIAATEGKDVDLPVGTVLRVRLDSPLDLR
jgi:hypothetical protein